MLFYDLPSSVITSACGCLFGSSAKSFSIKISGDVDVVDEDDDDDDDGDLDASQSLWLSKRRVAVATIKYWVRSALVGGGPVDLRAV